MSMPVNEVEKLLPYGCILEKNFGKVYVKLGTGQKFITQNQLIIAYFAATLITLDLYE